MSALPTISGLFFAPRIRVAPARRRAGATYFTPGVIVVSAIAALGLIAWALRMTLGLGATTHLSNAYPWGIWIGIDVATGVALAAGGFTTAFLAHILHRDRYHALVRPALLTAMLGYTFVALGVATDLGRFWAMWHVMLPTYWQPNSVLFEVAICVMCYLTVLYIEFLPVVAERLIGRVRIPGVPARINSAVDRVLRFADNTLGRCMTVFVILGIVLSCMHQSSLGTLMVITEGKLHPFWHTEFLPLLFILSAFAVGYPMVILESMIAHRSFRLPIDTELLSSLARFVPYTLGLYLAVRIADLTVRGQLAHLLTSGYHSRLMVTELALGVITPLVIFATPRLRARPRWLFAGAALVVCGVAFNRLNVFLLAYTPLNPSATYFPSLIEIAVTAGAIALTVLLYRFLALNFPVIEHLDPPSPEEPAPIAVRPSPFAAPPAILWAGSEPTPLNTILAGTNL